MNKLKFAVATLATVASVSAQSALVTYIGSDNAVVSLAGMTNSVAAAGSFGTAAGPVSVIDFESGLPAGVTIAGGSTTNNSGCGALCGFNTTAGGANFQNGFGVFTISFTTAIDAFGMYITGLQTDVIGTQTITFFDGLTQTIAIPSSTGGGGAFVGFIDAGASIASVSYDTCTPGVGCDIISFDDIKYRNATTVPEPGTLALVALSALGLGVSRRRRR